MGDISAKVEAELVKQYPNLKVDVVKLAHHGSALATSKTLIEHYRFQMALISAGRNNRYHHPSSEVITRLQQYHISYRNTQTDHAVTFYVFRHGCFYRTAAGMIGFFIS